MAANEATVRKRNELSLKQKYELVKLSVKYPSLSAVSLAKPFDCGKTQVYGILKNKGAIFQDYESNAPDERCRKRTGSSRFSEVNKTLYEWISIAVQKNIYPDGCHKALKIAEELGINGFKGSNGWLEKWKARHNIKKMVVSGESGEVSGATVESWYERLPEILSGFTDLSNIWNMDETGCFWKALPTTGLREKGKACNGGKQAKSGLLSIFL